MMRKVELEPHEWGQVMQIIGTAPWNVANGLLMKIGQQLREQELPSHDLDKIREAAGLKVTDFGRSAS
jgi:hypothetical protein